MTLPNGSRGVTYTDWGITVDGTVPDQANRTRDFITGQLETNAAQKPWGTDITNVINGLLNIGELAIRNAIAALNKLAALIDGVVKKVGASVSEFVEVILGLLGFGNAASALNALGTGQLSEVNPNLLINGAFNGDASMPDPAGGWYYESGIDHTGVDGSGSAAVTANGSPRTLLSNSVTVSPSNEISSSVWVSWQGRYGAGAVALVLNVYDVNGTTLDSVVLADAPAGSGSDWVQLKGTYTVPELIGGTKPDHVALAYSLDDNVKRGTFWWDDAELRKINPIQHGYIAGFQGMIDGFLGTAGAGLTDFVNGLKSFDLINTGTVVDDFVPGVGRLIENGVRGLMGLPPPTEPYTHDQFFQAATSQAQSTIGNAHSVQQIWQYLSDGVFDDFERAGTNLGDNWSSVWGYGNGTLITEGHNAAMPFAWPGGNSQWFSRYVGLKATSTSDYQINYIVLGSAAGSAVIPGVVAYNGYNYVLGRVGGSGDYIAFGVGGDGSWTLTKLVSGSSYIMASGPAGSVQTPGPGSLITLYCGSKDASNPRRFIGLVNTSTVVDMTESTTSGVPYSNYGSLFRGRGLGMRAEGVPYLTAGWVGPGLVNYWSSQDQP